MMFRNQVTTALKESRRKQIELAARVCALLQEKFEVARREVDDARNQCVTLTSLFWKDYPEECPDICKDDSEAETE